MPYTDKVRERAWARQYQARRWQRYRSVGACGVCGLPCDQYAYCNKHRALRAAANRRARERAV